MRHLFNFSYVYLTMKPLESQYTTFKTFLKYNIHKEKCRKPSEHTHLARSPLVISSSHHSFPGPNTIGNFSHLHFYNGELLQVFSFISDTDF